MTGYLLLGAGVLCAVVLGVAQVRVSNAERDAANARAELDGVRAAIATEREAYATAARDKEAAHRAAVDAIEATYAKERKAREKRHASDLDRIRDGFRLRDPGASEAAACNPSGTAPAAGSDAAASGKLSGAATRFLLDLANEADDTVIQLQACQQYALSVQTTGENHVPTDP